MITVVGAGAFGSALATALQGGGHQVTLWARGAGRVACNVPVTNDPGVLTRPGPKLLSVPTQALRGFLTEAPAMPGPMILCCKGLEKGSHMLPTQVTRAVCPDAEVSVLTGPGFAEELLQGKPTALTLATGDPDLAARLAAPTLRLYSTDDIAGAQVGGAAKNVIAIACGIAIGMGLGESARAALLTRGMAEMIRLARHFGGRPETLAGLSGLGDLGLTCTSEKSRNYRHGIALGAGRKTENVTVEGVATATAIAELAGAEGIDMPIAAVVSAILTGEIDVAQAMARLLSRPLKPET